MYLGKDGSEGI